MTPEALSAAARRAVQRTIERQRLIEKLDAVLARPENDPTRQRVVTLLNIAAARKAAAEPEKP